MRDANKTDANAGLPGIEIPPGPVMLEFLDASMSTVITRCSVLTRHINESKTLDESVNNHFELFSTSLRNYLKILGLYLYVPLRRECEQGKCDIDFNQFENDTVSLIERIAVSLFEEKQNQPFNPTQLAETLMQSSELLKSRHEEQKKVLYPIYLEIWKDQDSEN